MKTQKIKIHPLVPVILVFLFMFCALCFLFHFNEAEPWGKGLLLLSLQWTLFLIVLGGSVEVLTMLLLSDSMDDFWKKMKAKAKKESFITVPAWLVDPTFMIMLTLIGFAFAMTLVLSIQFHWSWIWAILTSAGTAVIIAIIFLIAFAHKLARDPDS